jgi:hypothetical protein
MFRLPSLEPLFCFPFHLTASLDAAVSETITALAARQRILRGGLDATSIAYDAGYESVTVLMDGGGRRGSRNGCDDARLRNLTLYGRKKRIGAGDDESNRRGN